MDEHHLEKEFGFEDFRSALDFTNRVGELTSMIDAMDAEHVGYRVTGIFRSAWNWLTIFITGIVAIIISALTAITPILRIFKISIADALRFE